MNFELFIQIQPEVTSTGRSLVLAVCWPFIVGCDSLTASELRPKAREQQNLSWNVGLNMQW